MYFICLYVCRSTPLSLKVFSEMNVGIIFRVVEPKVADTSLLISPFFNFAFKITPSRVDIKRRSVDVAGGENGFAHRLGDCFGLKMKLRDERRVETWTDPRSQATIYTIINR